METMHAFGHNNENMFYCWTVKHGDFENLSHFRGASLTAFNSRNISYFFYKYNIVYNLSLHNYHDLIYILNLVLIIDKHSNKVLFSNEI